MNELETYEYLIPANVTGRFEFFQGFGWSELLAVLIAGLFGFFIFLGLGIFEKTVYVKPDDLPFDLKQDYKEGKLVANDEGNVAIKEKVFSAMVRILAIFIPSAAVFFMVKKDALTGYSLYSMFKYAKKFSKSQKLYLYKY